MSTSIWALGLFILSKLIDLKRSVLVGSSVVLFQLSIYGAAYLTDWEHPMKLYTSFPDENYGRLRNQIEVNLINDFLHKDVVIVKYNIGHNLNMEWVYNGANPDDQEVVWLRHKGKESIEEIKGYYPKRKLWILNVPNSDGLIQLTE